MKYSMNYILVTGMAEGLKIWRIFIWGHNLPPLVEIGLTGLPKLPYSESKKDVVP